MRYPAFRELAGYQQFGTTIYTQRASQRSLWCAGAPCWMLTHAVVVQGSGCSLEPAV